MSENLKIIVTGGAGFIGSAVIRYLLDNTNHQILNIDKLTYAGNLMTLSAVSNNPSYQFLKADICDGEAMNKAFSEFQPDGVMHLAAESHVDRSIEGSDVFIQTNILGTYTLLEQVRKYLSTVNEARRQAFKFHHISTDEVYGSLGTDGLFTEQSRYQPNSPYSASKAASDHLVRAWGETYDLPVVISNCSNNYGPYQFPEKLIPLMIQKALQHEPLPVYGSGENVRDWLYVDDHASALYTIFLKGKNGEVYNVGGHNEVKNIDVVNTICDILDAKQPSGKLSSYRELISFVKDRPGHDMRYAIDASKIAAELNWTPQETFASGIDKTIQWYLDNPQWCGEIATTYSGQRLGAIA